MDKNLEKLSLNYPIGKCILPEVINKVHLQKWANEIFDLPKQLNILCQGLSPEQFDNKYRLGGWTIRQLLFHLTDSHTHSYIRFKWTLTEDKPVIKAYLEKKWAILQDSLESDPFESIEELSIIQRRLARVINSLSDEELTRTFIHPETGSETTLAQLAGHYAWHGNHHMEHIRIAISHPANDYVPVSCDFYDQLVVLAMRKTPLTIHLNDNTISELVINDIFTSNKEEFLVLSDEQKVRLDNITKLVDCHLYINS